MAMFKKFSFSSDEAGTASRLIPRIPSLFRPLILPLGLVALAGFFWTNASANVPGGIISTTTNVTLTDNGDGTLTMDNGIVHMVITANNAAVQTLQYTYTQNGTVQQNYVMPSGTKFNFGVYTGNGIYTHNGSADTNTAGYCDLVLTSNATGSTGIQEVHYSMLKGSPGFYATAILTHGTTDGPIKPQPFGSSSLLSPAFNWVSIDSLRSYFCGAEATAFASHGTPVDEAKEIGINADGGQAGQDEDKFYSGQDHGDLTAWGWSSVGTGGLNIGAWLMTNLQFSDGGPLKRDITAFPFTKQRWLNNSTLTTEIGQGSDGGFYGNEQNSWTKVVGPYFFYVNALSSTTGVTSAGAASALYTDAKNQAAAEVGTQPGAWPYPWFTNSNYAQSSGRGTVTGQLVIQDAGVRNPVYAGTWVGLVAQPYTGTHTYDFQQWVRPYQYWTKTDSNGNFTIKNVVAGSNYTLYAFGPGASGTFISQLQTGGNPPWTMDVPSSPFAVTVTSGTTALGTINWPVARTGSTVFELGFPDRKTDKFRHLDDYWAPGQLPPSSGFPSPIWSGPALFSNEYPNGMTYTVGTSKWDTDWNYILPSNVNLTGAWQPFSATINFNLATTPTPQSQAAIFLAVAGTWSGQGTSNRLKVAVNGFNLEATEGAVHTPNATDNLGIIPPYDDNGSAHLSNHDAYWDERITFPASVLHAGQNTITLSMPYGDLQSYLMLDYLRLELAGYVPPPPATITAYAGDNQVSVVCPVVPGSERYYFFRSTSASGPFTALPSGGTSGISGSDTTICTYKDATAVNGTTYYYQVESWNVLSGSSAHSVASTGVTPTSGLTTPPVPTNVQAVAGAEHTVNLTWAGSASAGYYSVQRATMYPDGAGNYYPLKTITLNDHATSASLTDTSVTDGMEYSYTVAALNGSGTSAYSTAATAKGSSPTLGSAPAGLTAVRGSGGTSVILNWTPVPGALGYDIFRSTSASGPFAFPSQFIDVTPAVNYVDTYQVTAGTTYYYEVFAVNAGSVSTASTVTAPATSQVPLYVAASLTGTLNTAFTYTPTVLNGPATFSASGLPPGVAINSSTGVLSGTPSMVGTFIATVTSTNSSGSTTSTVITTISQNTSSISSSLLSSGTVNQSFNYQITGSNSPTLYTAVNLPPGLSINSSTGVISGTPTTAGQYQVSIGAEDGAGGTLDLLNLDIFGAGSGGSLTWTGAVNSTWNTTTANWSGSTTTYTDGDVLTMNDTGSGGTITLSSGFYPLSLTVSNSSKNYTLTGSGGLNGIMTLTKSGTGSLTLGETNNYYGNTIISAGLLSLTGSLNGSPIVTSSTGIINEGSSGSIGDVLDGYVIEVGSLTLGGSGTSVLGGSNSYSGMTQLNTGTLQVQANSSNTTLGVSKALSPATPLVMAAGTTVQMLSDSSVTFMPLSLTAQVGTYNFVVGNISSGTGNTVTLANMGDIGLGSASTYNFTSSNGYNIQLQGLLTSSYTTPLQMGQTETLKNNTAGSTVLIPGGILIAYPHDWTETLTGPGNFVLGPLVPDGSSFELVSTCTGTVTLNGPSTTYGGTVSVNSGTMLVNGVLGITPSATTVNVANGATLGGSGGTVSGDVSVANGGALAFNVATSGVTGISITGALTLTGTTNVTPIITSGSLTPGTYIIATYGSLSGTFNPVFNPPPGFIDQASFDTSTPGVIKLIITPPAPHITSALTDSFAINSGGSYTIIAQYSPNRFGATGLPPGMSINTSTGVISGKPTVAGIYSITISAYNAYGSDTATLSLTISPPDSLEWIGSASQVWDTTSTNWLNGASQSVAYLDGDAVTFDDSGSGGTISIASLYAPETVTFANGTKSYTLTQPENLSGSMQLIMNGTGTVTINGTQLTMSGATTTSGSKTVTVSSTSSLMANMEVVGIGIQDGTAITAITNSTTFTLSNNSTYTGTSTIIVGNPVFYDGGVQLNAGVLKLGNDIANSEGLGTGTLSFNGGTLQMYDNASDYDSSYWNINISAGSVGTLRADSRCDLYGTLTGAGTLNLYVPYIRTSFYGDWSAFTGTINVSTDSSGGDFRIYSTTGLPGSAVYLGPLVNLYNNVGSKSYSIGSLAGDATSTVTPGGGSITWSIGGLNTSTTYNGVISGSLSITKVGTGDLTLAGANTYTGSTVISTGRLFINGSTTSATSVASGATVGGSGTITGNVTVASGGQLIFNVTSGAVTGPTVHGNLALNGTINVTPHVVSGTLAAGTYTIVTYSGTLTGSPNFVWVPAGTGLSATFDTSVAGIVKVTLR